jgi:hypothetical protein
MFDFDLTPCNLATFHLALVFHITCVKKMVLSMKVNVGPKSTKHLPKKNKTKTSITIEIGGLDIDSQCIFLM